MTCISIFVFMTTLFLFCSPFKGGFDSVIAYIKCKKVIMIAEFIVFSM